MQSLLKTVVGAATVGIVVAGAVIFYVEYKIDQVTQAVLAPIAETRDRVDGAVEGVERSVASMVDSGGDIVDDVVTKVDGFSDVIESTMTVSSRRVETLGEDVMAVFESSADRTERTLRHGAESVNQFWDSTGSELIESWSG
ncbi:MAG: hypothetical protein WCE80_01355 [Acidimicrobiia bacterium]